MKIHFSNPPPRTYYLHFLDPSPLKKFLSNFKSIFLCTRLSWQREFSTEPLFHFLSLLHFMAVLSFPPEQAAAVAKKQLSKRKKKHQKNNQTSSSSWNQIKNLLSCKQIQDSKIHDPSKNNTATFLSSSCSSICPFGDIVHGNTRVVHRGDNSPGQETMLLSKKSSNWSSSSSRSISSSVRSSGGGGTTYIAGSSRGMQFRKLSGCYECHSIVDPNRYPTA